jgi:hypothetical protein
MHHGLFQRHWLPVAWFEHAVYRAAPYMFAASWRAAPAAVRIVKLLPFASSLALAASWPLQWLFCAVICWLITGRI